MPKSCGWTTKQFTADPWRPYYHIAAKTGLINDPNGFSFHQGRFQLFYQWNPFGCEHKNKHWGHFSSSDLIHWQAHPAALAPTDWFDKNGCYSGTAVSEGEILNLYYTGNVRQGEQRLSYQCKAVLHPDGHVEKLGPMNIEALSNYTGHVRDPKYLSWQDQSWLILGAQTLDQRGGICLLQQQQEQWLERRFISQEINLGRPQQAYMWECPDLFELDQQWLLLACPQGIELDQAEYTTTNLSGYFTVDMSAGPAELTINSEFNLLDHGFEFYAPQTLQHQGTTLLIGWLGLPDDGEHPSVRHNWTQMLGLPRSLSWENGCLRQRPIPAFKALAQAQQGDSYRSGEHQLKGFSRSCMLDIEFTECSAFQLSLPSADDSFSLHWSEGTLVVERGELGPLNSDTKRIYQSRNGNLRQLQLFIDSSSFELFVNDGEAVLSGRLFPQQAWHKGQFKLESGQAKLQLTQLSNSWIEEDLDA
ncbi:sucrose-6-phosphate hydrolase [Agarivorans sp. QJM3NY_33]|uniref:sucrose-6-phosphate hydrolase n=1 Tax=Agarivorans sp. QJM3NY_33 TaxID=3421432 RepID=UPI003D7C8DCF